MKSKKIVYFDENQQDKTVVRMTESTSKKNVSISKGLRESSSNKIQKNMLQSTRISVGGDKAGGSQKIKILLIKDGFIFQKKYMIYDIQCTLVKKTEDKFQITQNTLDCYKETTSSQNEQLVASSQKLDEDYLFLNLETSSFGVTKGMVRQNFPIQRDSFNYIQVRTVGYVVENVLIYNKKIEFIQLDANQCIDQNDLTIIEPIKLIEEGQAIRQAKIQNHYQKKAEGRKSKSLNCCWNLDTSMQNVQVNLKSSMKKGDPQWAVFFNSNTCNTQTITQRDRSNTKRMSNYTNGAGDKTFRGESKANRDNSQKFNLTELMKAKDIAGKPKTGSRKMLNDSSLSYGTAAKTNGNGNGNVSGKQNKKEDIYGLEQLHQRKVRTKTAQNEPINKLIEPLQLAQCQFKMAELEINRYGLTKKNP